MNRLDQSSGTTGQPPTPGSTPVKRPDQQAQYQALDVEHSEVPFTYSNKQPQHPALEQMPLLEERDINITEAQMSNLIQSVEKPEAEELKEDAAIPETPKKEMVFVPEHGLLAKGIAKAARLIITKLSGTFIDQQELGEAKKEKARAKKQLAEDTSLVKEYKKRIEELKKQISKQEKKLPEKKFRVQHYTQNLSVKRKELTDKEAALEGLRKKVLASQVVHQEAVAKLNSVTSNGKGLTDFAGDFLTSVRDFYAACHPKSGSRVNARMVLHQDLVTLNTDNGPLTLNNVDLSLADIEFVTGPRGKPCPIFKIDSLEADIDMPLPDGNRVKTRVVVKGVKLGMDLGIGGLLKDYVTASNGASALAGLIRGLGGLGNLKPSIVSLSAQEVEVTLKELDTESVASLVKKTKVDPEPGINKLFRTVDNRITAKVGQLTIQTEGEVEGNATLTGIKLDYRPRLPKEDGVVAVKKGATPRRMIFSCQHATGGINNTAEVVTEIASSLSQSNPLDMLLKAPVPNPGQVTTAPEDQAAKEKKMTLADLIKLTENTYGEAENIEFSFTRDIDRAGHEDACVTGYDRIKVRAGSVTVGNYGEIAGDIRLRGLNGQINMTDEEAVKVSKGHSITPPKLDINLTVEGASAEINAPKPATSKKPPSNEDDTDFEDLPLTQKAVGSDFHLYGQARLETSGTTHITGVVTGHEKKYHLSVPSLKAEVTEEVLVKKDDMGVYIPKGVNLQAGGVVAYKVNDRVRTIDPDLEVSGTGSVYTIIKGKRVPVDLNAAITIEKARPKLFVRVDPDTGQEVITPVLSAGSFSFAAVKAGPMMLGHARIVLDDSKTGCIEVSDAEIDFDELLSSVKNDTLDQKNRPKAKGISHQESELDTASISSDDDIESQETASIASSENEDGEQAGIEEKIGKRVKLPLIVKGLLRRKKIVFNAKLPFKDGSMYFDQLRTLTPRFINKPNANIADRIVTKVLNLFSGAIIHRLQKFSIILKDLPVQQEDPAADPIYERKPVLKLAPPFRKAIPLPVPVDCIRPDQIIVTRLFHQQSDLLMVDEADVALVEQALDDVAKWSRDHTEPPTDKMTGLKLSKPATRSAAVQGLTLLTRAVFESNGDPLRVGLIHLIAKQMPLKAIEQMFTDEPRLKDILTRELSDCASIFLGHPGLCHEAVSLFKVIGQPLDQKKVEELIEFQEKGTLPQVPETTGTRKSKKKKRPKARTVPWPENPAREALQNKIKNRTKVSESSSTLPEAQAAPVKVKESEDPLALGLKAEKALNVEQAIKYYRLAIEQNRSEVVVQEKLGLLLLREPHDDLSEQQVNEGIQCLIKAARAGNRRITAHLEALQSSSNQYLAEEARRNLDGLKQEAGVSGTKKISLKEDADPVALGLLMEETFHNEEKAKQCYSLAIKHHKSEALAHERLGLLLLRKPHDKLSEDQAIEGIQYLMNAVRAGNQKIAAHLEALESSSNQYLAREATLNMAILKLAREATHKDFDEAMKRLTALVEVPTLSGKATQQEAEALKQKIQETRRTRDLAYEVLHERQHNGHLIFHNSDLEVYTHSQELLKKARECIKKNQTQSLAKIAKEVGMKCLYGSHGMVRNTKLAHDLLLLATKNKDSEAAIHFKIAVQARDGVLPKRLQPQQPVMQSD